MRILTVFAVAALAAAQDSRPATPADDCASDYNAYMKLSPSEINDCTDQWISWEMWCFLQADEEGWEECEAIWAYLNR